MPLTVGDAIENAARLLQACELETDLAKMDRLTAVAEQWVSVAALIHERADYDDQPPDDRR